MLTRSQAAKKSETKQPSELADSKVVTRSQSCNNKQVQLKVLDKLVGQASVSTAEIMKPNGK